MMLPPEMELMVSTLLRIREDCLSGPGSSAFTRSHASHSFSIRLVPQELCIARIESNKTGAISELGECEDHPRHDDGKSDGGIVRTAALSISLHSCPPRAESASRHRLD
jgi:hypothetical protein